MPADDLALVDMGAGMKPVRTRVSNASTLISSISAAVGRETKTGVTAARFMLALACCPTALYFVRPRPLSFAASMASRTRALMSEAA